MKKFYWDFLFSVFCLFGSIYLWILADFFPKTERYKGIDADLWPKFLSVLIVLCSFLLIIQFFVKYKEIIIEDENKEKEQVSYKKMLSCVVLIFCYFLTQNYIGFILATAIFIFLGMLILGYKNKNILILYSLGFTIVVTAIFVKLLTLPLPRGVSYFETFSYFLY